MKRLGLPFLDLLKMDIEGSEYTVLPAIFAELAVQPSREPPFCQLALEQHCKVDRDRDVE